MATHLLVSVEQNKTKSLFYVVCIISKWHVFQSIPQRFGWDEAATHHPPLTGAQTSSNCWPHPEPCSTQPRLWNMPVWRQMLVWDKWRVGLEYESPAQRYSSAVVPVTHVFLFCEKTRVVLPLVGGRHKNSGCFYLTADYLALKEADRTLPQARHHR